MLLLHGGLERSRLPMTAGGSIGWPHTRWFQDRLSTRFGARGIEVWALLHRYAGWNSDQSPSPVPDARWALEEAARLRPGVPVVLVGHSMGARTALRVADSPSVIGVVGLCPWFPASEVPTPGVPLRVAYAEWDWECPLSSMTDFLRAAAEVTHVRMENLGRDLHYMLRARRWERYLLDVVTELAG